MWVHDEAGLSVLVSCDGLLVFVMEDSRAAPADDSRPVAGREGLSPRQAGDRIHDLDS